MGGTGFGFWFLGRRARAGGKIAGTLSLGRAQGSSARTTPLARRALDARWFLQVEGGVSITVALGPGVVQGSAVARGRGGGRMGGRVCGTVGQARHDGVHGVPLHFALP